MFNKLKKTKNNVTISYIDTRIFESGYEEIGLLIHGKLTHIIKVRDGSGRRLFSQMEDKLNSFWFFTHVGKAVLELMGIVYAFGERNQNITIESMHEIECEIQADRVNRFVQARLDGNK